MKKYSLDKFEFKKYGRLTVLEYAGICRGGHSYLCKCDCGKEKVVLGSNLVSGLTKSCGCLRIDRIVKYNEQFLGKPKLFSRKNLIGEVFGDLVVVSSAGFNYIGKDNRRSYLWNCKCSCGNVVIRSSSTLKGIRNLNCGCKKSRPHKISAEETKYKVYKRKAESRNLEFSLSFENFRSFLLSKCFYCGSSSNIGIDRMDNTIGYTIDNSISCCKTCNIAKNDMTLSDFVVWFTSLFNNWWLSMDGKVRDYSIILKED